MNNAPEHTNYWGYNNGEHSQLEDLFPEDFNQGPEQTIEDTSTASDGQLDEYFSGSFKEDVQLLEQSLRESIKKLQYEHQDDEQLGEILPALVPIITAVAPTVVKGVSSLISRAGQRRRQPQRQAPRRAAPRQTVQPQPRPQRTSTTGTGQVPVQQLLGLLSNPRIMNLIQQAARGGRGERVSMGREHIEVSLGSILNAVSQYAQMASESLVHENQTEIPEYLIDAEGNFKCDVSSPRERAEVLMELIQEDNR